MNTDVFEGYTGIRIEEGLFVENILFPSIFLLLLVFAFVFRLNYPLFLKIINDSFSSKERKSLFDIQMKKNPFFKVFLKFQLLFLCTLFAYATFRQYFGDRPLKIDSMPALLLLFGVIYLFYLLKQCFYLPLQLFNEEGRYRLWKTNYHSLSYLWGISLYPVVVWILIDHHHLALIFAVFICTYLLFRIILTGMTFRIFYDKNADLLYLNSYLCAQEIIPLLFLYEGLDYLHNIIETGILWH